MLSRSVRLVALSLIALTCAAPACAGPLADMLVGIVRDIQDRQRWPDQYTCADRQAVAAPFAVMVANGWERQNTLADQYFEPATGQLSEAGRLRVQWILIEAPECRRAIYVHRTLNPQEMAGRMKAVEEYAVQILPPGTTPAVFQTDVSPYGWSADWVDSIGRKYEATAPNPRLPKADTSQNSTAQ